MKVRDKKPPASIPTAGDPLITVDEAQKVLRVPSDQIVYAMIRQGVIPRECVMRMGARRIRLRRQLLMNWINGVPAGSASPQPKSAA